MHLGHGTAGLPAFCGGSAEKKKALSVPVPGAVVIAPLTESFRNYGSAGGSFTVAGAPAISSAGATFNGVNDGAVIDSGASNEFTLISSVKGNAAPGANSYYIGCMFAPSGLAGLALTSAAAEVNWRLTSVGIASAISSAPYDQLTHTVCLKRIGTTTTLYLDGTAIATLASGTIGSALAIAYLPISGGKYYITKCTIRNSLLYHSALSAPNQAAVEAWVAAA